LHTKSYILTDANIARTERMKMHVDTEGHQTTTVHEQNDITYRLM